jgi:class 3 adenylate cyclase/predicted ATPase
MERYAAAFAENEIEPETLRTLTADDLKDLGVTLVGHRRKILDAIAALDKPVSIVPQPGPLATASGLSPAVAAGAERRQLTVMFVDLVGSTELSRRFDPERMGDLLREYQNMVAGEIVRFEGHVAKFMGDGVLAYFGWPTAHEDAAERAVRAGLAVADAIPTLSAVEGQPLAVRVGIATGLVVVGDLIGSGAAREEAVVGETPNLAARLQALAKPGTVVISELTYRLLGRMFDVVEIPPQRVRGFDVPVRAFCVAGEGQAEGRFEALHGGGVALPPLAGREHEIALLLERWRLATSGEGQVVQLVGEPGIGKSRIMEELRERIEGEPHTRLRYFCSPYHTQSALYPVSEQLIRAAGIARNDPPERKLALLETLLARSSDRLDEAVPLIAALLSIPIVGRYPPPDLTPQKQKARTFEVLFAQLESLARAGTVLMLLEDTHWLDPTSAELFDQIAERIQRMPVMLVATSRPEALARWNGFPHATLLTLNRLGRAQAVSIIDGMTAGRQLPTAVLDQILTKTEGVPLFVEELTKVVLESGLLLEGADGLVPVGPLPPFAIPATLHDSLMARLDRLAPVKEVAQIGAVIGREFPHELLAAVAGLPQPALDQVVDQLVAAGLVFRRGAPPQTSYIFKHALVQDTAYGSLLISRRQQLHARIAQVLEGRFPETAVTEPELLAHHFGQAGLTEKAVEYHEQAGRRALARSATTEALAQFGYALDSLDGLPHSSKRLRRELAIQLALGSGRIAAHGFADPATGSAYRRAAELCEELGETRELFPVLYGLCLYHLYGADLPEAGATADRLLKLAEASGSDSGLLFFAHRAAGVTALPAGDFPRARLHLERALALYDPGEHRAPAFVYAFDPRVVCLDYLARTLLPLGFPEQALAISKEAVTEARRVSHRNSLALPLFFGGVIRQILGDYEGVRAHCAELAQIAAEAGFRFWQAGATILHGWSLAEAGNPEAGRLEIRRGVQEWRATGAEYMQPYFLALLAQVEIDLGSPDAALPLLEDAQARVERTGERWFAAEILRLQGDALKACGPEQLSEAEACFARALETAAGQQARFWELRAALSLARIRRQDTTARERVAQLCAKFDGGFALPELEAARVLADSGVAAPMAAAGS